MKGDAGWLEVLAMLLPATIADSWADDDGGAGPVAGGEFCFGCVVRWRLGSLALKSVLRLFCDRGDFRGQQ